MGMRREPDSLYGESIRSGDDSNVSCSTRYCAGRGAPHVVDH
jgi:hypothetical protein